MFNKKNKKYILYISVFLIIFMAYYLFTHTTFSLTEVSCSSSGIWLKYTWDDETFFTDNIDTCKENKENGWVGEACVYATTPKGNTYRLGCYLATPESTQKISCGNRNVQTGKEFIGGYITNEGAGRYTILVEGKYYLKSENFSKPHSFSFGRNTNIDCPTIASQCSDGTPTLSCSSNKPLYCDKYGLLYPKASKCGCPSGLIKDPDGETCILPTPNPEPPNTQSYPQINETTQSTSNQTQNNQQTPSAQDNSIENLTKNLTNEEIILLSLIGILIVLVLLIIFGVI